MAQLADALSQMASVAASVNDLVKEAEHWLFDQKYLLPGERVLRDAASAAFASIEAAALEVVRTQIPAQVLEQTLAAMFSKRRGRGGGTTLEWLKIPPGKDGPTGLNEATQKIAYLKTLGVAPGRSQESPARAFAPQPGGRQSTSF